MDDRRSGDGNAGDIEPNGRINRDFNNPMYIAHEMLQTTNPGTTSWNKYTQRYEGEIDTPLFRYNITDLHKLKTGIM